MNHVYRTLARNLRRARRRKGLTPKQVAAAINVELGEYECMEAGIRLPTLDHVITLCELYGISVDDLLVDWNRPRLICIRGDGEGDPNAPLPDLYCIPGEKK